MKAEYHDNEKDYLDYYDEVEICTESAKAHYKSAKKRALFSLNMVILLLKKTEYSYKRYFVSLSAYHIFQNF